MATEIILICQFSNMNIWNVFALWLRHEREIIIQVNFFRVGAFYHLISACWPPHPAFYASIYFRPETKRVSIWLRWFLFVRGKVEFELSGVDELNIWETIKTLSCSLSHCKCSVTSLKGEASMSVLLTPFLFSATLFNVGPSDSFSLFNVGPFNFLSLFRNIE